MVIDYSDIENIKKEELIFVMGTFDILHVGHIHFLEQAKAVGSGHKLLVGIIPDKIVCERKGPGRPVTGQTDRAQIVNALKIVDYVVILPELTLGEAAQNIIGILRPEISVASRGDWDKRTGDWQVQGTKLVLIDKIPEQSTTKIVQKIQK